MSISYPTDAEGFEHPHWCDLALCTSPSALRIRGVNEADLPRTMLNAHLGTPKTIEGDRMAETRFIIQPWQMVDRPVDDEVEGLDLHVELLDDRLKTVVPLTVEQLQPLVIALADLRDLARTGKPQTRADRAIRALAEFGVLDAGVAARMLPMWREHLTRAEIEQVVDWFVDGSGEFTPPSKDDSNSGPGWPLGGAQ